MPKSEAKKYSGGERNPYITVVHLYTFVPTVLIVQHLLRGAPCLMTHEISEVGFVMRFSQCVASFWEVV